MGHDQGRARQAKGHFKASLTMTAASIPPKKKKTKRRRISKHVVEAKKKAAAIDDKSPSTDHAETPSATAKAAASESDHANQANANQAIAYLKAYIESKDEDADEGKKSAWKFNKNTQTWLIRHMYNAEIVSKSTFALLLEYFRGLQGNTKSRVLQEATERVLQYKELEKKQEAANGQADEDDKQKLQRKEYKRARQIVQLLQ